MSSGQGRGARGNRIYRMLRKKGCYLVERVSVFIKIRVLFWPEISAKGVLFNFDNERMRPPKYLSDPPSSGLLAQLNQGKYRDLVEREERGQIFQ